MFVIRLSSDVQITSFKPLIALWALEACFVELFAHCYHGIGATTDLLIAFATRSVALREPHVFY